MIPKRIRIVLRRAAVPALAQPRAIRSAVTRGVTDGALAYVSKPTNEAYTVFRYRQPINESEIEISDETCIIRAETAEAYLAAQRKPQPFAPSTPDPVTIDPVVPDSIPDPDPLADPPPKTGRISLLRWRGEVTPLKWTIFYTKVLSRFARDNGLRIAVQLEVQSDISAQTLDDTRLALKEMGLNDDIETS